MEGFNFRLTAKHVRILRRKGGGIAAEGVRLLAEEYDRGYSERRSGPVDRRRKRK